MELKQQEGKDHGAFTVQNIGLFLAELRHILESRGIKTLEKCLAAFFDLYCVSVSGSHRKKTCL